MSVAEIPELVKQLYVIVDRLENIFPGRKFTPDGHLVGSIGEVLAAHAYALTLLPNSVQTHDALAKDKTLVQIKATQSNFVALSSEPDHLIVLKLNRDGSFTEEYNGPGREPWTQSIRSKTSCQCKVTLSKLRLIMKSVPGNQQITRVHWPDLTKHASTSLP